MTTEQLEKTVQESIADAASEMQGIIWVGKCGNFVRRALAKAEVNVEGLLRDIGEEIDPADREAGDVIIIYGSVERYEDNDPFTAGILVDADHYMAMKGGDIMRIDLDEKELYQHRAIIRRI